MIWQTKSISYLGINIPIDLTKLLECKYLPVQKKNKEDIARWNLIPFFSLSSSIESIKNSMYLDYCTFFKPYQLRSIKTNSMNGKKCCQDIYGKAKDQGSTSKLYSWQKKKGDGVYPLSETFLATQIRTIVYWCNPKYNAQWKSIEEKMCSTPIQAVIVDNNLQNYINSIENPWVKCGKLS